MAKQDLFKAKKNKQDEYITSREVIDAELKHYIHHFKDKVILCNCDDPFESNFFLYFAMNFQTLGLKKLITTSYAMSKMAGTVLPLFDSEKKKIPGKPHKIELVNIKGIHTVDDLKQYVVENVKQLKESGDFRSIECEELLKESDVVVTNPPFSLFREYLAQIIKYDKKFLILGDQNAITYKEVF